MVSITSSNISIFKMSALFHLANVVAICTTLAFAWPDKACHVPPGASNFKLTEYSGVWYEIGKIQTAGGAFFEKECVCTQLKVYPANATSATVSNVCRNKSPSGKLIVANSTIVSHNDTNPARFVETFDFPGASSVAYNVISLDQDYSVEYDCGTTFGITNYCIHILSRKPTANATVVQRLLDYANITLGLNDKQLEYKATHQQDCTYASKA
eukprot:TRINITY_DN7183_c0_g1_i1.p1 TRINITY_DN7183_c0_g1~~TRINITY_DN7183_c0_g1_i1.p1  ORF type:complete len:212 (+),score=42.33 TRINITY_DN7183_c0_g1_i1:491-1126(+)